MKMNFEDKKFTRDEIIHAMRLCADGEPCEQCEFFEAECPRGYNPCHEYMMLKQAADLLEEQTAKVVNINMDNEGECSNCRKTIVFGDKYCRRCGARLDWSGND